MKNLTKIIAILLTGVLMLGTLTGCQVFPSMSTVTIGDFFNSLVEFVAYISDPNRDFSFTLKEDQYQTTGYHGTDTNVQIPSTHKKLPVTSIDSKAFYHDYIESITIPDSIVSIDDEAFSSCTGLTSVTFGENSRLTTIGNSAFAECRSLTDITIPDSVTSIGYYAFSGCDSLTNVTIPDSVTSIGSYAFSGCPIETATVPAVACSAVANIDLKTVIITSGTGIGSYAFYGCSGLTSVTIPDSVTSIGYYAFSGCDSLTSVIFENTNGWTAEFSIAISATDLADPSTAATYLTSTYSGCYWSRS